MKTITPLVIATLLLVACHTNKQNNSPKPITEEEIQIAKELIQGSFDDIWAGLDWNVRIKITEYNMKLLHVSWFMIHESWYIVKQSGIHIQIKLIKYIPINLEKDNYVCPVSTIVRSRSR